MATRLQIYNGALLVCKERSLASLSEPVKARRLLDTVWNDGAVRYCLEQGQWFFGMRGMKIEPDPDIDSSFGYTYAFDKPTDWVLTSGMFSDERFRAPLVEYSDEVSATGPVWAADITPIYVKFVSDDANFGGNLAAWPETFNDYIQTFMASKIVLDLTGSKELYDVIVGKHGMLDKALMIAKNRSMMTQPMQRPPSGSWVRARQGKGWRGPMGDGGTGGSLIG